MSVFHEGDGDESSFTCCAFSACERFLILGTCYGHLKFYNVFSGEEEANYTCHSSAITHLEPSRVCTNLTAIPVPVSRLFLVFYLKNKINTSHYTGTGHRGLQPVTGVTGSQNIR